MRVDLIELEAHQHQAGRTLSRPAIGSASRLLKKGLGKRVPRWRRCGEYRWGRFELRPQGEWSGQPRLSSAAPGWSVYLAAAIRISRATRTRL